MREREREKERKRQRDRERDGKGASVTVLECKLAHFAPPHPNHLFLKIVSHPCEKPE